MKKMVAGIVLLVAVIVIAFFFFPQQPESEDFVETPEGEYETELYFTPEEIAEYEAIEGVDVPPRTDKTLEECKNEIGGYAGEHCIIAVAYTQNNPFLCEEITDSEVRDLCYNDLAYFREAPEHCEKVMEDRGDCYYDLALKTKNHSFCEKANAGKKECISATNNNNAELCLSGTGYPLCIKAVQEKNTEWCEGYDYVKDSCYYDVATDTLDGSVCGKITLDEEMKNTCYYKIATETNNVQYCTRMSENKENCIAQIAINTNNETLCNQAGTERQQCIEDVRYLN
jgi:hypothetical protein